MALSKAEQIHSRIAEGLDVDDLKRLYRFASYAFGDKLDTAIAGGSADGEWPDFPDQVVRIVEIGQTKRILTNQLIGLSRVMYAPPRPRFPQLDPPTAEVRTAFFMTRMTGDGYPDGEWQSELERAVLEGDSLGYAAVQIGLVTNPRTGMQRVTARHIPVWQWIYDRHARDPLKSRWVTIQHYLDPEDAKVLYGEKAVEGMVTQLYDNASATSFSVVKVYEYYDIGIGRAEPTYAVMIGSVTAKPIKIAKNPFGCIPLAIYVQNMVSGRYKPLGRIEQQIPIQEALNDIERSKRMSLKRFSVDVVDQDALDPDDLKRHMAGNPNVLVKRIKKSEGTVWERFPAPEYPRSLSEMGADYERELNSASGVTDADRGNLNQTQRTATENQLIDMRSQVQGSWTKRAVVMFYRRLIEKVLKVAELYDRDPIVIDFQGRRVLLNDPGQPASFISNFLKEYSRPEIDEDSLTYRDVKAEGAEKIAKLNQLMPLVQAGIIDPLWLATEMLKALDVGDPKVALRQMQPMMPQTAAPMQGDVQPMPMPPPGTPPMAA